MPAPPTPTPSPATVTPASTHRTPSAPPAAGLRSAAARIDAATPPQRDRFVDAIRVGCVLVVVVGHWLVRTVTIAPDGAVDTGYLLAQVPWTQALTWIIQVMGLFFIVGASSNIGSWQRAVARGSDWSTWVRARARRLLAPLVVVLVGCVAASALLAVTGWSDVLVIPVSAALIPAWFLAAYLLIVAATPLTAAIEARAGWWGFAALAAAATFIDALRLIDGLAPAFLADGPVVEGAPAFAAVNYLFVWLAVAHLGAAWSAGRLEGVARRTVLGLGGAVALVAGVAGPYPLSMVGVPGAETSNSAPPTVMLVALAAVHLAIALAVRDRVSAALERPLVWAPVAVIGTCAMTVFLHHQVAAIVGAVVAHRSPVAELLGPSGQRAVHLLVCVSALIALVGVFGRFEHPRPARATALHPVVTLMGVVVAAGALALAIVGAVGHPDGLVLPGPLLAASLAASMVALGVVGQRFVSRPGRSV